MDDDVTTTADTKEPSSEDHAYEDSWYRRLKALAEARSSQSPEGDDEKDPPAEG